MPWPWQNKKLITAEYDVAMAPVSGSSISVEEERVGLFILHDCPSDAKRAIDIIAVHGLGGHWKSTWTADSGTNWLKDFVPEQLQGVGIEGRIMSYGYDANTVLTKSIADIEIVATILLDRIDGMRQHQTQQARPLVFVAHSMGGIVVKKAMILAHDRSQLYGHVLKHIDGIMFLGVPHRGADSAYWATFAANVVRYGLLGFSANPAFVQALKRNSSSFADISRQFVDRGAQLTIIRTFFETEKMGNIIIVDQASAVLNLPNERPVGLAQSNHRTMCKFERQESQRYTPVGQALVAIAHAVSSPGSELQEDSTRSSGKQNQGPWILSAVPIFRSSFTGRVQLLQELSCLANETFLGQNRVVLWGLPGMGKTRIAFRFFELHRHKYDHVVWIDVSSAENTFETYLEALSSIGAESRSSSYDKHSPLSIGLAVDRLNKWLETRKQPWLLIIDSLDDLEVIDVRKYIPQCDHGTILITSVIHSLAGTLDARDFEVQSLTTEDGSQLLQNTSKLKALEKQTQEPIKALARQLDNVPLALEQAGAYIRATRITVQQYEILYRNHYKEIMQRKPAKSEWDYDKNRSVFTTLSLLLEQSGLWKNDGCRRLLTLISLLGLGEIRYGVIIPDELKSSRHPYHRIKFSSQFGENRALLKTLLCWHYELCYDATSILPLLIADIERLVLIRVRRRDQEKVVGFAVHAMVRKWIVESIDEHDKPHWVLFAATIASLRLPDVEQGFSPTYIERMLARTTVCCHEKLNKVFPDGMIHIRDDLVLQLYGDIIAKISQSLVRLQRWTVAEEALVRLIEFEMMQRGETWLRAPRSLMILEKLAYTYVQTGRLEDGQSVLQRLIDACGEVLGKDNNFTVNMVVYLKEVRAMFKATTAAARRAAEASNQPKRCNDPQMGREVIKEDDTKIVERDSYVLSVWVVIQKVRQRLRYQLTLADACQRTSSWEIAIQSYRQLWPLKVELEDFVVVYTMMDHLDVRMDALKQWLHCEAHIDQQGRSADLLLFPLYAVAKYNFTGLCKHLKEIVTLHPFGVSLMNQIFCTALSCDVVPVVDVVFAMEAAEIGKAPWYQSVLHVATYCCQHSTVLWLTQHRKTVNDQSSDGWAALHLAARNGDIEMTKLLLHAGADVESRSQRGLTALQYAAWHGHSEVFLYLCRAQKSIVSVSNDGFNALHIAAFKGQLDIVNFLLSEGLDARIKSSCGWTALHLAIHRGHLEVVRTLYARNPDRLTELKDGWTILHIAAHGGHLNVLGEILTKDVDIGARADGGFTALHLAAREGHVDAVLCLLQWGAEIDARTNDSCTALHYAAQSGHLAVTLLLLENGADARAQPKIGLTATGLAENAGHGLVVEHIFDFFLQKKFERNGLIHNHF